jgi:hypothetical protein
MTAASFNRSVEIFFRDEVLIFVATLGACGLLALGVLELVWPSRRAGSLRHRPERAETHAEHAEALAAPR